jgi:hypothetical protein
LTYIRIMCDRKLAWVLTRSNHGRPSRSSVRSVGSVVEKGLKWSICTSSVTFNTFSNLYICHIPYCNLYFPLILQWIMSFMQHSMFRKSVLFFYATFNSAFLSKYLETNCSCLHQTFVVFRRSEPTTQALSWLCLVSGDRKYGKFIQYLMRNCAKNTS